MSISGIDFLWWKLHALTDSADISTITIENMPGGTPWVLASFTDNMKTETYM